mmetsp:Transcript_53392/g.151285  ORF Transcript_53392/g.151285 Transcript_53392/m.151285 type:complete len:260 (-) Transcript_53392:406-1185(-)
MVMSSTLTWAPKYWAMKFSDKPHLAWLLTPCKPSGAKAPWLAPCQDSDMEASNSGMTRLKKGSSCEGSPPEAEEWPMVKVGNCVSFSSIQISSVWMPTARSSSPVWALTVCRLQYLRDLPAKNKLRSFCGLCWKRSTFSTVRLSRIFMFLRSRNLRIDRSAEADVLFAFKLNFGIVDSYSPHTPFFFCSGAGSLPLFFFCVASRSFSVSKAFLMLAPSITSWEGVAIRLPSFDCGRKDTRFGLLWSGGGEGVAEGFNTG